MDLASRMSVRRSQNELQMRGVVPPNYFENPQAAYQQRIEAREQASQSFARKFNSRESAQSVVDRGFAHPEFWNKSAEEDRQQRQESRKQIKQQIAAKLKPGRRMSIQDLAAKQIIPEDNDVLLELRKIALEHHRMVSAVDDLQKRLPFEEFTARQVAKTMMQYVAENEDSVHLCTDSNCTHASHQKD
jgi:HEPN domain-containing protein